MRVAAAERALATATPTEAEEIWRYSRIAELDLDRYGWSSPPTGRRGRRSTRHGRAGADRPSGARRVRDGPIGSHRGRPIAATAGRRATSVIVTTSTPRGRTTSSPSSTPPSAARPSSCIPRRLRRRPPIVVTHRVRRRRRRAFPRSSSTPARTARSRSSSASSPTDVAALCVVPRRRARRRRRRPACATSRSTSSAPALADRLSRSPRRAATPRRSLATVALGGDYARVRTDCRLVGQRRHRRPDRRSTSATATRCTTSARSRTTSPPTRPATCCSRARSRTTARSVYTGLIHVGKEATGTNAFQTNRNLKLVRGRVGRARAEPRDRDQRRALQPRLARSARSTRTSASTSRAAACRPTVAERLIVLGFFDEVLEQLPVPDAGRDLRRPGRRQARPRGDSHDAERVCCALDDLDARTAPAASTSASTASAVVRIGDDFYAIGDTCTHAEHLAVRGRGARATSARSSAGSTAARSRWRPASRRRCRPPSRAGLRRPGRRRQVDVDIVDDDA